MIAALIARLVKLVSGATARWVGCEPASGQRVYIANHSSHLDFVVIWASLPRELRRLTRPVAARDYWRSNRLRRYLATRVFDAVLIDRRRIRVRDNPTRLLLEALADGRSSLILFPEGTRGPGGVTGKFQGGIYHLARRKPGLPFVPVRLENLNRILPKGEVLPVPLLGAVTFGREITLNEGESKPQFLDRARQAVEVLKGNVA